MDSNSLMLTVGVLFISVLLSAFQFMRFVGTLTGSDRKAKMRGLYPDSHLSFDERVAERMREMDRDRP